MNKVTDEQVRRERENIAFHDWWTASGHAEEPSYSLTVQNACHATWQARAALAPAPVAVKVDWRVAPIAINFLIECAATDEPGVNIWPGGWDSDAGRSTREWLKSNGLVTGAYKLTDRGQAWFEAILRTPLPTPPAGRAE